MKFDAMGVHSKLLAYPEQPLFEVAGWWEGAKPQSHYVQKYFTLSHSNMCWFVNKSEPFKIQGCLWEGGNPQVTILKATLDYPNIYMWCRLDSLEPFKSYVWGVGLIMGHPVYVWNNLHFENKSYKIRQDGRVRGRVLWKSHLIQKTCRHESSLRSCTLQVTHSKESTSRRKRCQLIVQNLHFCF